MNLPTQNPYNPRWTSIVLLLVIFGACRTLLLWRAIAGSETEMEVEADDGTGALVMVTSVSHTWSGFYWTIGLLCLAFVALGILLAVRRVRNPQSIEFLTDALILPYGLFQKKTVRIPYSSITAVSEAASFRQRFLYLDLDTNVNLQRRYTLVASFFPDRKSYAAAREFLLGLQARPVK